MSTDRTRASDTERERVVGLLREAATEGRLTVEELDARCERAYSAVTRGELAALLDDLPVARWPSPPPPAQAHAHAPAAHDWASLRPWQTGVQPFTVRWPGPPDPRRAGEWVLDNVVPLFTDAGYRIVRRSSHQLQLERPGWTAFAAATIAMALHDGYSTIEIAGSAPQDVRQALVDLRR